MTLYGWLLVLLAANVAFFGAAVLVAVVSTLRDRRSDEVDVLELEGLLAATFSAGLFADVPIRTTELVTRGSTYLLRDPVTGKTTAFVHPADLEGLLERLRKLKA